MSPTSVPRCPLLPIVCSLIFLATGCVSDSDSDPTNASARFARLWPNEDGNRWSFDYQRYFATTPMIPELEGLADIDPAQIDFLDLERRLTGDLPAAGATEAVGVATLHFEGTVLSPDGRKQNLKSELGSPAGTTSAGAHGSPGTPSTASTGVSPLMARIFRARPDLRERMIALGYVPAGYSKASSPQDFPVFSFGNGDKFEKQENWIGGYGDLNADSSYTIVKGPLVEGTYFRHQLVPDLSDDLWEYGWILGTRWVETPAGTFNAVAVVYFIDFGHLVYLNEQGFEVADFRSYSISSLFLSPDFGPVYQRTLDFFLPPIPELNIDIGVMFSEATLREIELQ